MADVATGRRHGETPITALWTFVGAAVGLLVGTALGFGAALIAMLVFDQAATNQGGLYGMMEVIICTPIGGLIGLLGGGTLGFWGVRGHLRRQAAGRPAITDI